MKLLPMVTRWTEAKKVLIYSFLRKALNDNDDMIMVVSVTRDNREGSPALQISHLLVWPEGGPLGKVEMIGALDRVKHALHTELDRDYAFWDPTE